MIRISRSNLLDREQGRLTRYQERINGVRNATRDPDAIGACVDRQWRNFGRTKLRTSLVGHLNRMSHYYCVYCGYNHGEEIDHFDPVSRSPSLAFAWSNYNWSCGICNGAKLADFELDPQGRPLLLNPTGPDETARYFTLIRLTGSLRPHPGLGRDDQVRARYTIDTLNLNREALAEERRRYATAFFADLNHYCNDPTDHGAAVLARYLDQARHLQLVVFLMVRSQDPQMQPLVEQWLHLSPAARTTLYDRDWLQ